MTAETQHESMRERPARPSANWSARDLVDQLSEERNSEPEVRTAETGLPPEVFTYARQPSGSTPLWAWFALTGVVLAGLLVRLPGLGGPVVGYHSFNEAFYFGRALLDLKSDPFSLWWAQYALNPPLYPFLLRLVLSVFGPTLLVARTLSTAAALGTAVAIFFLGRRLYGVVAGLGGAVVIALAPGTVLVGRNIQIEGMLGLVVTLAALAWVIASDEESLPWAVAAGVFAGLAVLLKLQGIVIIPAFALAEVIRTRSLARLFTRVPLVALLSFCVVGLPWNVWNLLQPARASLLGTRASEFGLPDARFLDMFFAREAFGFLSPLLAVAVVVGIAYLAWRRRPSDVLVLLALLANVVFYSFYHLHTYYLYAAIPFAALCAVAPLEPLARKNARASLVALGLAALLLVPFAESELAGKKLGYWSNDQIAVVVVAKGIDPSNAALGVDALFRGSWEPALRLNGRGMDVVSNPLDNRDTLKPGERLVTLDPEPRPASADSTPLVRLSDEHVLPVFFGFGVDQSHDALFYFAMDQPRVVWVGPWYRFGTVTRTDPMNWWASLLSPAFTEKIRTEASQTTSATPSAP